MKIDDRKLAILQAIIMDYISTAQPVGSRTISKKFDLGISPATIRNEMSDLEDMGLLEQPHTSAGRIPSQKGYRLYVDRIMRIKELSPLEQEAVKREYAGGIDEIDDLIKKTSKIMSQLTKYTSLVMSPQMDNCKLKHIHFVPIDSNNLVAVIVTDTGVVKNTTIKSAEKITPDYLENLTRAVNEEFGGMTIEKLNKNITSEDYKRLVYRYQLLDTLMPMLLESMEEKLCNTVYSDGVSNIFNFPEYSDITKARNFLAFMEEKDQLVKMINMNMENGIHICIGSELENKNIEDCSLVTATYKVGDKVIGKIGIIGPTRMEYGKVVGTLEFFRDYLSYLIDNYLSK